MTTKGAPLALVTGASGGIGREVARALAGRGFELLLSGRNERRLETLCGELAPAAARFVVADLSLPAGRRRLREQVDREGLSVRVLVNNAGFGDLSRFVESSRPRQLEMIQVNIAAVVELAHWIAPSMVAAGEGYILNVASTAGFAPGALMAVYYATKAFVVSFSLALAEELAPAGVRVCALCPGATRTGFDRAAGIPERPVARGAMDPRKVAVSGLDGLFSGRRLIIPGLLNKVVVHASRFLPRSLLARYLLAFNARK